MKSLIRFALVTLTLLAAFPQTAAAQSTVVAFGAADSIAAAPLRELMDCYYDQAQGSAGKPGPLPKAPKCTSFNLSGDHGLLLFMPNNSLSAKFRLRLNLADLYAEGGNLISYTDYVYGYANNYDGIQFGALVGASFDAADIVQWNADGNVAKFGNVLQVPVAAVPLVIGFNGKDGNGNNLNIQNATPLGGTSGLNLSRKALCGIFSGHITRWNNPILTALNKGIVLGVGPLSVVHPSRETAGDTYLLTSALVEQCRYEFGPMNESDPTIVSYAFPWTPRTGIYDTVCPAVPLVPKAAVFVNWPDAYPTDQCGAANKNPGGGIFWSASNQENLRDLTLWTNGSVTYGSPTISWIVNPGSIKTANIESQWDITAGTGKFQPPSWQGAAKAMSSTHPRFRTAADRGDPRAWSVQGINPNPVVPDAYPISGFVWIAMYQCYQPHPNGNNQVVWITKWLNYVLSSTNAYDIWRDMGFAEVPSDWREEAYALFGDANYSPRYSGSDGCIGKPGAY